ncbi:hypothetical protein O181_115409 [Austropuccinia psidii MF-1]|uniref:Uncharacterized protein n=1 Tax=Austropuccinia psidii MF-1 TaxID=1389203 RepID=A0A9Q3K9P1_9BASI|nr:hypothetical protein [Austropuccinia psidii MF-1]
MPVQNSPPSKNTRSQRNPAVLTPTARVPLEHTFGQRTTIGKSSTLKKIKIFLWTFRGYPGMSKGARARLGEVEDEEGERSVDEDDSGETEVADALAIAPEVPQGSNQALSSQPLVSQAEPRLLKMMEQMTQFMGQLTQAVTPRDNYKATAFKTPSMKAPASLDGTQAHKLRGFIQSCQLIFHNDPANFFSDRKKVFYSTSFLTGRAGK